MKFTDEQIIEITFEDSLFKDRIMQLIVRDITQGNREFLDLINDYKVEFDDGLSSRMRNWWDDKGMLLSTRNAENKGKRRLSFLHRVWFQMVMSFKDDSIDLLEFIKVRDFLMIDSENKYGLVPMEIYTMTATSMLNLIDYYLLLDVDEECPLILGTKEMEVGDRLINFSQIIREVIAPLNLLTDLEFNKRQFIKQLISKVEKIRQVIGIFPQYTPHLSHNDFVEAYLKLMQKPDNRYINIYDILFEDKEGNIFGIEIKRLPVYRLLWQRGMSVPVRSFEELIGAVKYNMNQSLKE